MQIRRSDHEVEWAWAARLRLPAHDTGRCQTQENLAIEVSDRLGGQRLEEVPMQVVQENGLPKNDKSR
jgi:hypothetical protein